MRFALSAVLAAAPLAAFLTGAARADEPGEFDHYVLSLSWSPNWCALEGDLDHPQCEGFGWILHGLWPQREDGWPEWCRSPHPDPSRSETAALDDIAGSAGLAWHAWNKHGTCSGLPSEAYFELSREAFEAVVIPPGFGLSGEAREVSARDVEAEFLAANPELGADGLTVTCRDGHIQEVRICLTRGLAPRRCAPDVARDCRLGDAVLEPIR